MHPLINVVSGTALELWKPADDAVAFGAHRDFGIITLLLRKFPAYQR